MKIIIPEFLLDISFDYTGGKPPDKGIISVQIPLLSEFLDNIGNGPYILNMTYQDTNILYNTQKNIGTILVNFFTSDNFLQSIIDNKQNNLNISINTEYEPNNEFLMATYKWPIFSFSIPSQIKRIYINNSYVEDKRIREVPLGVYNIKLFEKEYKNIKQKNGKLLVAISNHTMSRAFNQIYLEGYSQNCNWITIVKDRIPQDEFYSLINEHSFVFCPSGNGLDTYRLWETLYLGSIPILDHPYQKYLDKFFNIVRIKSFNDYAKLPEISHLNNIGRAEYHLNIDNIKRAIINDYESFI